MNNLKYWFDNVLKQDLLYKMNIGNSFNIPQVDKISLNINFKSAIEKPKTIVYAATILKIITNQKPVICRAKKSIAVFKIRKGMVIGCKVSLRKKIAFDFLSTFILLSLGKIKNLKVCKVNNTGGLSIGIENLFIFPQLLSDYEKFPKSISSIVNIKLLKSDPIVSRLVFSGLQIPVHK